MMMFPEMEYIINGFREKDRIDWLKKHSLIITDYNTIKCEELKEIEVDEFLRTLEDNIISDLYDVEYNNQVFEITYMGIKYTLKLDDYTTSMYELGNYDNLTIRLKKLVDIQKKIDIDKEAIEKRNRHFKEMIKIAESGSIPNDEVRLAYIAYLKSSLKPSLRSIELSFSGLKKYISNRRLVKSKIKSLEQIKTVDSYKTIGEKMVEEVTKNSEELRMPLESRVCYEISNIGLQLKHVNMVDRKRLLIEANNILDYFKEQNDKLVSNQSTELVIISEEKKLELTINDMINKLQYELIEVLKKDNLKSKFDTEIEQTKQILDSVTIKENGHAYQKRG